MDFEALVEMMRAAGISSYKIAKVQIFFYLLERAADTGRVKTSYNKIARDICADYSLVAETMQQFQQAGIVTQISRGEWQVDISDCYPESVYLGEKEEPAIYFMVPRNSGAE